MFSIFFYIYFTSDGHANTIISSHVCMIIWCLECWKWHFRASRFQNFLGEACPQTPLGYGAWRPLSYTVGYSSLTSCLLQILLKALRVEERQTCKDCQRMRPSGICSTRERFRTAHQKCISRNNTRGKCLAMATNVVLLSSKVVSVAAEKS